MVLNFPSPQTSFSSRFHSLASIQKSLLEEVLSAHVMQGSALIGLHLIARGNTPFAAICGDENYTDLSAALGPVLGEVKSLLVLSSSMLDVDGTKHNLEFFLGGDYKVKNIACVNKHIYCGDCFTPHF